MLFFVAVSVPTHFCAVCHHFNCIISLFQGRGVLQISSDRDDQRIFVGLKFFDFRIFLGKKILASIFGGSLIEVGIFVST